MPTVRDLAADAQSQGMPPEEFGRLFLENFGVPLSSVSADTDLDGLKAGNQPKPQPAAAPAPKAPEMSTELRAVHTRPAHEAQTEKLLKGFDDSIVGSTIKTGLGAGAGTLESFKALPSVVPMIPAAMSIAQAKGSVDQHERLTGTNADMKEMIRRIDAGEHVSEKDRDKMVERLRASIGVSAKASSAIKAAEAAHPEWEDVAAGARELAPIKGFLDEEAEIASRLKKMNKLERTLADADDIIAALPHLITGMTGFTDQDQFEFGRQIAGGAIGGTAALWSDPITALKAKPLSTLSEMANPLLKMFKAARHTPKIAKFIDENPAILKLAELAGRAGNIEIPIPGKVKASTIDIGKKTDAAEPKIHRTTADLESLKVKHLLDSAALGAGAGLLAGMPGFGAIGMAGTTAVKAWIRNNPEGAAKLAGIGRWLDDVSNQSTAGRTQQVRGLMMPAARVRSTMTSLADRVAKRIEAGEIGADSVTLEPGKAVIGDRDVGRGGIVSAEAAEARRGVAPLEPESIEQGRRRADKTSTPADRIIENRVNAARKKVVRLVDRDSPVPKLDEVSAGILGEIDDLLQQSGVGEEFGATLRRTLEDAIAGGHSLLKSELVRQTVRDSILSQIPENLRADMARYIDLELLDAADSPFAYNKVLEEVEATAAAADGSKAPNQAKPSTERIMAAMIPGDLRVEGAGRIDVGSILSQTLDDLPAAKKREIQGQVIRGVIEERMRVVADAARNAAYSAPFASWLTPGMLALRTLRDSALKGKAPVQWLPEGVTGNEMGSIVNDMVNSPVDLAYMQRIQGSLIKGREAAQRKLADAEAAADARTGTQVDLPEATEIELVHTKRIEDAKNAISNLDQELTAVNRAIAKHRTGAAQGKSVGQIMLEGELGRSMTAAELADFKANGNSIAAEFGEFVPSMAGEIRTVDIRGNPVVQSLTYDQLIERRNTNLNASDKLAVERAIKQSKARASSMGIDNPSSMDRYVSKGLSSTLDWHHKFSLNQTGIFGAISSAIKSNLTVQNPTTHVNNFIANLGMQAIRLGKDPISLLAEVYKDSRDYLLYRKDPNAVPDVDRQVFRIIDNLGYIDSDMIGNEVHATARSGILGNIEQRTPGVAKPIVRSAQWYNDKAGQTYRWGDQGYKISESARVIRRLVNDTRKMADGDSIRIRTSESAFTNLVKGKNKAGEPVFFRDGRELTPAQFDSILGAAARRQATDLFFDYAKVPGLLKMLRNAGPVSAFAPFMTWAWKSMDAPGKKGLIRKTLFDEDLYTTTNPKLLLENALESASVGLRRAMIVEAASTQMDESQQFLQEMRKFRGSDTALAFFAATADPNVVKERTGQGFMVFDQGMRVFKGLASAGALMLDGMGAMTTPEDKRTMQLIKQGRLFTSGDAMKLGLATGSPLLEGFRVLTNEGIGDNNRPVTPAWWLKTMAPLVIGQLPTKVLDVVAATHNPYSSFTTFSSGRQTDPKLRDDFARWAVRRITGIGWSKMALYGDMGRVERFLKGKEKMILQGLDEKVKELRSAKLQGDHEAVKRLKEDVRSLKVIVREELSAIRKEVHGKARILLKKGDDK